MATFIQTFFAASQANDKILEQDTATVEQMQKVPTDVTEAITDMAQQLTSSNVHLDQIFKQLIDWGLDVGRHILVALAIFIVGRYLVKMVNHLVARFMEKRKIEVSLQTFIKSFVKIMMQVLLIVAVIGALGINTTSFAALLASFGVAIGMALSGNLQNFAGGIVILFLKPYKVGDWIETQGTAGSVVAIQIFHTILLTADGKQIYIPNGALSSGNIINYTQTPTRRIEWVIGVEYDEDMDRVRTIVDGLLKADKRILSDPAPVVYLQEMADSSVNVLARAWVNNDDYWNVRFEINELIYKTFNNEGISFPFPQITVHQA